MIRWTWVFLAAWASSAGCGDSRRADGPWVADFSRVGDTAVVRTVSGSVWEGPARLVRDLRLGGVGASEETAFGDLAHVAVAGDGTIFVFDGQVPTLSRFDAGGRFLGAVGREGEGPGEYTDHVTGMVVVGGRLLVADAGTSRLSAYSLDGVYDTSLGAVSGLRSTFSPTLAPGRAGGAALSILTVPFTPGVAMPTPWPIGLEILDAHGAVLDTVGPQTLVGEAGRVLAGPGGDGLLVASESAFLFEMRRANGQVLRVEMPFQRVPYTEGERRMLGNALAPAAAADGESEVTVAPLKGVYLEFLFSPDGRVWARRPVADEGGDATWRFPRHQPSALDVFDTSGRYLGTVPLPTNARPVVATDTHLYLVELGPYDEPYLTRYRVEAPG